MPPNHNAAERVALIERLIPPPPADVAALRNAFSSFVAKQWQAHVPAVLADSPQALDVAQATKARFIAGMYARACYSMLLVSASAPKVLRLPLRAAAFLPQTRRLTIGLGSALLMNMDWLLPKALHRRLLLTSELMGRLDVVLDATASAGRSAVLRTSSLLTRRRPTALLPNEEAIVVLAKAARHNETAWQREYWETLLEPAVQDYCLAEALAANQAPDPKGMCHRWAGIEAAIKGMWYAIGSQMGLGSSLSVFEQSDWNREQQWMADTSLLMQMIDDWVDQDKDRGVRATPVLAGDWDQQSVVGLYSKTVQNLAKMLTQNRINSPLLQQLFIDLYTDYLHTALAAMRSGVAA